MLLTVTIPAVPTIDHRVLISNLKGSIYELLYESLFNIFKQPFVSVCGEIILAL